jgi:3-hydroxyacyl-CoA dehydrogenase/enoyl-CoA hydratase/3-hydroxybutyryl-CoA epimerase
MNAFTLEVDSQQIATLTFDLPGEKVNKFDRATTQELKEVLATLTARTDIKALLIKSGKPGIFIAGADIAEIRDVTDPALGEKVALDGQAIFNVLDALPYPTVALIDGVCVGGGFELALACDYRIATDNEKITIGLPEIKLGILPGWGGTQRLPKLVGLQRSLDIILAGKTVSANKAFKMGLVDAVVPSVFLMERTQAFLKKLYPSDLRKINDRRTPQGLMNKFLEKTLMGRSMIFSQALKTLKAQTKGQYPAPVKALQVIKQTYRMPLQKGLAFEAKALGELIPTAVSKNLIHVFYLNEAAKKNTGVGEAKLKPQTVERAAVIGAGVMGGGIAQLFAAKNIPVRLKDIKWEFVAKGLESAAKVFDGMVKRKRITRRERDLQMAAITGTIENTGLSLVDFAVEAIVEDITIKQKVLADVETKLKPSAVLASNTSSLSITAMGEVLKRPENFVGFHFFNPVHRMPLVEIIRGGKTSDQTVASAVAFAKLLGKTPIVCRDKEGFVVNRILLPYLNEAAHLLSEGHSMESVDQAMLDFGMPMGPVTLSDEVGNDVGYKVAKILEHAFGERMQVDALIQKIYDKKLFGKKSGKGFYIHPRKGKRYPNPEIKTLLPQGVNKTDAADILDRMVLLMVNEAALILEEGIAATAADIDIGMIFGTGFPPFKGGLCRYADNRGISEIVTRLKELETKYGQRFKPAGLLMSLAKESRVFYK